MFQVVSWRIWAFDRTTMGNHMLSDAHFPAKITARSELQRKTFRVFPSKLCIDWLYPYRWCLPPDQVADLEAGHLGNSCSAQLVSGDLRVRDVPCMPCMRAALILERHVAMDQH